MNGTLRVAQALDTIPSALELLSANLNFRLKCTLQVRIYKLLKVLTPVLVIN